MVLNYIWISFFLIAFGVAVIQSVFFGNLTIWNDIMNSSFTSAKTGRYHRLILPTYQPSFLQTFP